MWLRIFLLFALLTPGQIFARVAGEIFVPEECTMLLDTKLFSILSKTARDISSSRAELAIIYDKNASLCQAANRDLTESKILADIQNNLYDLKKVGENLQEKEDDYLRDTRHGADAARMLRENACYEALKLQRQQVEASSTKQKKANGALLQVRCR